MAAFTWPLPVITDESFTEQDLLADRYADLQDRLGDGFDMLVLRSEPAGKIMDQAAEADLLLRQTQNDRFRAGFVSFANGADLDVIAADVAQATGITLSRHDGELDPFFRRRIILTMQGASPAGPGERFVAFALQVDADVQDAAAAVTGPGLLEVSVLSYSNGGQPSSGLLAAVDAVMQDDRLVRPANIRISTVPAIIQTVDVAVRLTLYPGAPGLLEADVASAFRTAFNGPRDQGDGIARSRLGWDLTPSWLYAAFMGAGVEAVAIDAPTIFNPIASNRALALGNVSVSITGRNW